MANGDYLIFRGSLQNNIIKVDNSNKLISKNIIDHNYRKDNDNFTFLGKLFVWSIFLEPLLYFKIFEPTTVGITGNLSRLLQTIVIIGLFIIQKIMTWHIYHGRFRFNSSK